MAPVADWSELPTELLHLISQRIDNEIDLIRFRSICSNWRSSTIPNHHLNILPFKFPLFKFPHPSHFTNNDNTLQFYYLSKRSLFLIKPKQQQQHQHRPWLIRVTQKSLGKTKLSQPSLISFDFPYMLDFNELSVLHLGCEFLIEEDFRYPSDFMYPEKVIIVTCHDKELLALSIIKYPPYLLLIRCSDGHRYVIPYLSTPIVDICLFKQRIYAIDKTGRTFTVGVEDLNVQLVAEPLVSGGGDIKFLIESEGDLLLVDVYHDDLMIHVFTFDEKARKWVKLMKNLGDRVLFLGDGCSFSASASDLCVPRGNCVIFMNNIFFFSHMKMKFGMSIFFHLDQGRRQLSPLSNYRDYYNLFWPPPEWIVKSCIPD